jgi:hypothetical protein
MCNGNALLKRGGMMMQQRKETGHTEVISIEEYLTKRKKIRDMDRSQRRGRIPEENQTLILAELYI